MAYDRLNLKNGTTLTEDHIKHIENGIINVENQIPADNANYWAGKKLVANGDSITYGSKLLSGEKPYPTHVANKLGMTLVGNYAIGGSTVARRKDSYEKLFMSLEEFNSANSNGELDITKIYVVKDGSYKRYAYKNGEWTSIGGTAGEGGGRSPLVDRISEMDPTADVVLIMIGTNDFYYDWTEVGSMEEEIYRNTVGAKNPYGDNFLDGVINLGSNLVGEQDVVLEEHKTLTENNTLVDETDSFCYINIPVQGGHTYQALHSRRVCFLDSNKTFIDSASYDMISGTTNFTIIAPDNAAYVNIAFKYLECTVEDATIYNVAVIDTISMKEKVVLLADGGKQQSNASYFTYFGIPVEAGKTYFSNNARRASFLDNNKTFVSTTNIKNDYSGYIFTIPDGISYMDISYSYSDIANPIDASIHEVLPMDTNTKENNVNTFYGAYHQMCRYLCDTYAGKDIFFITPIKRVQTTGLSYGKWDLEYPEDKNSFGLTLNDYRNMIIEIAEYYSIPVIDLYAISGINPHIEASLIGDEDGKFVHPNLAGHERMASIIAGYMRAFRM